MSPIFIALLAYLVNALASVIDKYLLQSSIPRPFAYAFWASALSIVVLVLIPFGVSWPGIYLVLISFVCGLANFLGIIFLFRAVRQSNVSVASPKFGAFSVISTYILSVVILGRAEVTIGLAPLIFFAAGIYVLSRADAKILLPTAMGGFLVGLALVLLKYIFDQAGFINGIFWTRIGFSLSPLFALAIHAGRKEIIASFRGASPTSKGLFILNKLIATVGFIILYYAILTGDVATVNALSGFQFVFVLILALYFRKKLGIAEDSSAQSLKYKISGISLIVLGFILTIK